MRRRHSSPARRRRRRRRRGRRRRRRRRCGGRRRRRCGRRPRSHAMYNGIGLSSARGSGTSGYVQSNKFHRDASRLVRKDTDDADASWRANRGGARARAPNAEILAHNAKRAIEVAVSELEDACEERGASEGEKASAIAALRARLEAEGVARAARAAKAGGGDETHAARARKDEEMKTVARAFGISTASERREGDAFDQELQRKIRDEKREAREREIREREREKRKREKKEKKEKKRAKKEAKLRERVERKERERVEKMRRRGERELQEANDNILRFEDELRVVDAEIERRGLRASSRDGPTAGGGAPRDQRGRSASRSARSSSTSRSYSRSRSSSRRRRSRSDSRSPPRRRRRDSPSASYSESESESRSSPRRRRRRDSRSDSREDKRARRYDSDSDSRSR